MKRTLTLIAALALLTACNSTPKVDMGAELKKQPDIQVSWEGEDKAPGVSGGFCSDVLCLDTGKPDWSAMTFTPFVSGTPVTVHISTTFTIKELNVSLKDDTGHTIQNNLSTTDEGNNTYLITDAFKHTGNVILSVKVNFTEDNGYGQSYFPLAIQ